jgi:hypothetical protein
MPTTKIYDELLAEVTDELERQVLEFLMQCPSGVTRSVLIMHVYGVWVPPEELANNVYDRKIRKTIEALSLKHGLPIVSSSGKSGYKLSDDPNEIEEMAREFDGRAAHCNKRAFKIRTIQKTLALTIREYRQTHKIVSQERLL